MEKIAVPKGNDRINLVAHHPDNNDLFYVEIICETCHHERHWGKEKVKI